MFLIFEGIIKSPVKLEHPENAEPPIDVTVSGIINFPSNPVHSINKLFSIAVIEDDNFILIKEEHSEKAYSLIDVTESGIFISFNNEHA